MHLDEFVFMDHERRFNAQALTAIHDVRHEMFSAFTLICLDLYLRWSSQIFYGIPPIKAFLANFLRCAGTDYRTVLYFWFFLVVNHF